MDSIKDIIPQVLEKISHKKPQEQIEIQRIWQNLVDKKAIGHTAISGLKDGRLTVSVDSSAWLFQMSVMKRRLLKGLQELEPSIQQISFRIGKVK